MGIYESIVEMKQSGAPFVVATVVDAKGSTPRETGAKMIVKKDGIVEGTIGGGAIEKAVVDEALKRMDSGEAITINYDLGDLKMQCGGKMTVFLEPIIPMPQLLVFGAGHIAHSLNKIANMIGFRVGIIDNRIEFANAERFSNANIIIAKEYEDAFSELRFDKNIFIVIVTHKHLHDEAVLQRCVQQPFAYLGMIGSKMKVKKALDRLIEYGIDSQLIKRIHTPIGLDIGAQTPEEISIAIAAEMIAIRSGAETSPSSLTISND
jgi:xanthine dehydrogenase accessory factor